MVFEIQFIITQPFPISNVLFCISMHAVLRLKLSPAIASHDWVNSQIYKLTDTRPAKLKTN